ncbi:MAG: PP0621 family protein [Gammaproteobacteria bacterium]
MKYLVLLVVLVLGYAWWRAQRRAEKPRHTPPPAVPAPQDMVACAHCGVHLPRTESVTHGPRSYCCAEHQRKDAH